MNKGYVYIDGKAIITDDNGKQVPVEYYDNIDEVLVCENVIEAIEDRIFDLEEVSLDYKVYNKKHYFPVYILIALLMGLSTPVILYLMGNTSIFISTVSTIFGTMNKAFAIAFFNALGFLPLGGIIELKEYLRYSDNLKDEKGVNSELTFLRQQLVKEKEKLNQLHNEKTKTNENKEFRVVEVDDLEKMEKLDDLMALYYDLGYNGEKYYKYYKAGKLDTKLGQDYTDGDIEITKEYLEQNEDKLVKKKTRKKIN